ncbi:putative nucleotidyltransferase [Filibacter limicola]|uniref:tRNA(Met) cytidine acetate ligase n=1 Tax=Sporosarcina limicola TaxID=34101 RepID=A0A927MGQ8_9BACL|nr:nucleotidyltransferase [Sporosarcina limicola]MBE1553573.1 putative nucleotidyltransferase [Sporosarcina limicola]
MKAVGIIVEYNPFHNGHLYHALQAKHTTQADVIIAVMSGNFLQRGEPAFVNKWSRARMALESAVDIVFELPYAFATANAPNFAQGAIRLLDAAHCSTFCFGSEDGNLEPFKRSLHLIQQAGDVYEEIVKEAVGRGLSYPKALNEAYLSTVDSANTKGSIADLSMPNNILGFHYMEAAQKIGSTIEPVTIPRIVARYHDDVVEGNRIASATGIRKSFFESDALNTVASFIPDSTREILLQWQSERQSFGSWATFYPQLRFIILRDGPERLRSIADITEGIENLFYRAAANNGTFESFMREVKSKRYTWTRIQRMLTHIFTGFTYDKRNCMTTPSYLRLLGMSQAGKNYLNENKKRLKLPLVSKAAAFSDPSLEMDILASDLYALGIGNEAFRSQIGTDYDTPPIIIK